MVDHPGTTPQAISGVREPTTHDRTRRGWGHDHALNNIRDGGRLISIQAWGGSPAEGDYLILPHNDGSRDTARYRITSIKWPGNPRDQWFAECKFSPRVAIADTSDVQDSPGMKPNSIEEERAG